VDVSPRGDLYLDEPWLTIWWDSSCKCVHGQWKAFATSAEFRAGLMKGLEAIKHKQASAYVSDTRGIRGTLQKDQKWLQETWIPLAMAAGLKRLALVTKTAGLGRTTVLELVKEVDDEFFLRNFDTLSEALTWVAKA
jgi:hypothetical protein